MKTTLIDGKRTAVFDAALFIAIDLVSAEPHIVRTESLLIGIRNEFGEIYRVIGVTGMSSFVDAAAKLHALGYRDETISACEAGQGLDAVMGMNDPHLCLR